MKALLTRMFRPKLSAIDSEQPPVQDAEPVGIEFQRSEISPWTYHIEPLQ